MRIRGAHRHFSDPLRKLHETDAPLRAEGTQIRNRNPSLNPNPQMRYAIDYWLRGTGRLGGGLGLGL